jgi:hypothetical protein
MRGAAGALGLAAILAAPLAGQTSHLVIVAGLDGDAALGATMHTWAAAMVDAAVQRGVAAEDVVYLAPEPSRDPGRIDGESRKELVEAALRELAGRAAPDATVFIVLLGHGSHRGDESRFNLPGPDMSAADFAALLDGFPTQTVVFVNTTSASGGFLPVLSGANRVVVTATKSGNERNLTTFGGHFANALAGDGADVDKDGRVSVLEAFTYARTEVARSYERGNRLLTEHAMLDDDGDGTGSAEPGASAGDGGLARGVFLAGGVGAPVAAVPATDDPELRRLYNERTDLERRVALLRRQKDDLDSETYERRLEALLLELAMTNRSIREREGGDQ